MTDLDIVAQAILDQITAAFKQNNAQVASVLTAIANEIVANKPIPLPPPPPILFDAQAQQGQH